MLIVVLQKKMRNIVGFREKESTVLISEFVESLDLRKGNK